MMEDFNKWASEYLKNNTKYYVSGSEYKIKFITDKYIIDDDVVDNIFFWIELMHRYDDITGYLYFIKQNELEKLRKKIENLPDRRVGIVKKVFNYTKRILEYELEDGNFIPIDDFRSVKTNFDVNIMPDSYLRLFSKQEFRDKKIDEIYEN